MCLLAFLDVDQEASTHEGKGLLIDFVTKVLKSDFKLLYLGLWAIVVSIEYVDTEEEYDCCKI